MNNYLLKSPIFCLLVTVGCSTVPSNEKRSENSNYEQQIAINEQQTIKSLDNDSDEKRIEAARLASANKDFEAVTRILSSVKNPQKNNYVKSNFNNRG